MNYHFMVLLSGIFVVLSSYSDIVCLGLSEIKKTYVIFSVTEFSI